MCQAGGSLSLERHGHSEVLSSPGRVQQSRLQELQRRCSRALGINDSRLGLSRVHLQILSPGPDQGSLDPVYTTTHRQGSGNEGAADQIVWLLSCMFNKHITSVGKHSTGDTRRTKLERDTRRHCTLRRGWSSREATSSRRCRST